MFVVAVFSGASGVCFGDSVALLMTHVFENRESLVLKTERLRLIRKLPNKPIDELSTQADV